MDRSRPGGYTYVAQVFGRNPVVAPTPNRDRLIKEKARKVYADLGAKMTLLYHEEGTKIDRPFEFVDGLLVRPSDFSVTRTTTINGTDNFWWNYMTAPNATRYDLTLLLKKQLAEWESQGYKRSPFITSLIHENNFYRSGPEAWSSIYYTIEKGKKGEPLSPPYNLNAPDVSRSRTEEDKEAIFTAYEALVAYASMHLTVVTSEDLVEMSDGWVN